MDFRAELALHREGLRALTAEYDNEIEWCMYVSVDPRVVATVFIHPEAEC